MSACTWVPAMLVIGVLFAGSSPAVRAETSHPNVLVILADDQGWGDLSVHGNRNLATPNIDSLARDGAMFDRFYVCPVCSPTRAEFLTGRYHVRSGVHSTSAGGERLDLDERTIAESFKAAGYATGAFGKWHNGWQWPYHPNARGFDEFYGFCSGHWGNYFSPVLDHNGALVRGKGYITDDLTDHALRFIDANKRRPFFCYIPYNTPHSPMQVPDRFFETFAEKQLVMRNREPEKESVDHTRAALAMCENIDWNVGRLLEKLDALELADNTIVVYFSDNGPNGWRWNGGMKGKKGWTDEGGVRVPCLWRWPGRVRPNIRITQTAAAIDLLPTLADMAGIAVVGDKPLDGRSVKPLLFGAPVDWSDRMLFNHWKGRTSVRTQAYRLDGSGRLFDMAADPGQNRDVSSAHPAELDRLSAAVAEWQQRVGSARGKDDRPFPVGYDGHKVNYLPARDGQEHGNIKRSNKFPNSSFFTNWTSTNDYITWDIEVVTSGRYDATIYYTCRADDLGSTVQLRFGESCVVREVTEAHDPALVGAEHDRTKRAESYVKDFRPMSLGALQMGKGRGPLTLKAEKVAGAQVMDVQYVILTLVD